MTEEETLRIKRFGARMDELEKLEKERKCVEEFGPRWLSTEQYLRRMEDLDRAILAILNATREV